MTCRAMWAKHSSAMTIRTLPIVAVALLALSACNNSPKTQEVTSVADDPNAEALRNAPKVELPPMVTADVTSTNAGSPTSAGTINISPPMNADTTSPFQTVELAKTGDADKRMLIVEYTLEARQEKASGIVRDLT